MLLAVATGNAVECAVARSRDIVHMDLRNVTIIMQTKQLDFWLMILLSLDLGGSASHRRRCRYLLRDQSWLNDSCLSA